MTIYEQLLKAAMPGFDTSTLGGNWEMVAHFFFKLGQKMVEPRFYVIDFDAGYVFPVKEGEALQYTDSDDCIPVVVAEGVLKYVNKDGYVPVRSEDDTEGMGF